MAEVWSSLKSVRMKIRDPLGVIDLDHVTNQAALPVTPKRQTAYRTDDTGTYWQFDEGLQAWGAKDIRVSDETLNGIIDAKGVTGAVGPAIDEIIAGLYSELPLVQSSSGSENLQFMKLSEALAFYERLKKIYADAVAENENMNTGKFVCTPQRVVGGIRETFF